MRRSPPSLGLMRLRFLHPRELSPFDRLLRLAGNLQDLGVRVLDCRYMHDVNQVRFLFKLQFKRMGYRRLMRFVEQAGLRVEAAAGAGRSTSSIIVSSTSGGCGFCRALASSGCFLNNAWIDCSTGKVVWQLLCTEGEGSKLLRSLDDNGLSYDVEYLSPPGGLYLTRRQEAALELAFKIGFFNQPRSASTKRLAEALGISSAAASKLVRSGLRRLVEENPFL